MRAEPGVFAQVTTSLGEENSAWERVPMRGANYRVFQSRNVFTLGYATQKGENREVGFWVSIAQDNPSNAEEIDVDFSQKSPIFLGFNVYQTLWSHNNDLQVGLAGNFQYAGNFHYIREISAQSGLKRANGFMAIAQPVVRRTLFQDIHVFASPSVGVHLGPYVVYNYGWNIGLDIPTSIFRVAFGVRQNFESANESANDNTRIPVAINQLNSPLQIFLTIR